MYLTFTQDFFTCTFVKFKTISTYIPQVKVLYRFGGIVQPMQPLFLKKFHAALS